MTTEATQDPLKHGSVDDVQYHFVPVEGLRDIWPELQEGLEQVRASNGEPWIPEDVYARLVDSRAWLYTFYMEGGTELLGFMVLEIISMPSEYVKRLNVWVAWAKYPDHGDFGMEAARRIAHYAGLHGVVFSTPQEHSWVKKAKPITTWYEV